MKMTYEKLLEMAATGIGQGHRNAYRPFLDITRRNSTKKSTQSTAAALYGYKRKFAFYSRGEREIAQLLMWLGASDVREQMPLWHVPHPHLLSGAESTEHLKLPKQPGLLYLAKEAGIDHGTFIGTDVPYVATLDLMATVPFSTGPKLAAVSYKPIAKIKSASATDAILRRLELERLYCSYSEIHRTVLDRKMFGAIIHNVAWLLPNAEVLARYSGDASFWKYRDALLNHVHSIPIRDAINVATEQVGWQKPKGNQAFRILAWRQLLDIDFREPIVMSYPAKPGGKIVRRELQKIIFGGAVDVDFKN